jgi:hypothetical protein
METTNTQPRQDILDILAKRARDFKDGYRQNIAILGDELIGKTTLLKNFLRDLNDESLLAIYVEVVPYEFTLFCKRFLNSLLYNYLEKHQLVSSRDTLENLVKRSREALPQTSVLIERFLLRLDKERPELLFKDLFLILEAFCPESKKRCIVIFDEFQNLMELGIKNIAQELGKKIMFQKNALFIFSSSLKTAAKKILSNDLSLLFGNFETLELQMLKPETCETLIRDNFKDIAVSQEYIHFLINFAGGHPFYLKIISEEAVRQCRIQQKLTLEKEDLLSVLQQLLFADWGTFNLKFLTFLSLMTQGRNKNDLLYVLDAIACGKNRLKDLVQLLRKQRKEVVQRLSRLTELGLIAKNGSFYVLNDRLMNFWLKFVHYEKLNSLTPDHSEQVQHFRSMIGVEIDEFIAASGKKIADRVLDVFNLFEDDEVHLDRKKLDLSHFRELKIVRFEDTDLEVGIFGKSQNTVWLAAVKESGIKEHDVNEFIQLSKKFKHKSIHKIIIGLGDIERNARLLAKESRILTWDIASVNSLFDLFGKPRVIR